MKKGKVFIMLFLFMLIVEYSASYNKILANTYDVYINEYPVTSYTEEINTQSNVSSLTDGEVEVKKSVEYKDNGSFDITLFTEGKQYYTKGINSDMEYNIELVIDNSGSMYNDADRIVNVVNAVNSIIRKYSNNSKGNNKCFGTDPTRIISRHC